MLMRPGRRMMRRRSLVGAAATTAVVVGTAGAVSHHQQEKYAAQDAGAQPQAQMQEMQQAPAAAPAPAAPAAGNDLTSQLNQLAQLHASGVLSDQEFTEAKQKREKELSSKTRTLTPAVKASGLSLSAKKVLGVGV